MTSRTCYNCDFSVDEDCVGEGVSIFKIGTQTDDNNACAYCFKQVLPDDAGALMTSQLDKSQR